MGIHAKEIFLLAVGLMAAGGITASVIFTVKTL